jgi:energy-converting hydrogenase Eha subunit C
MIKIFLFPVRFALSIFTGAMNFILRSAIINKVFYIASGLMFLAFLLMVWSAIFISRDMSIIARILLPLLTLLISYLLSPLSGALKYLRILINRIEDFNKSLV